MKWRPVDILVTMLTIAIVGVILTVTIVPYFTASLLQEGDAKLLSDAILTLVAIVSMYVGSQMRQDNDDK